MACANLPAVRVEPELLNELEAVLGDNETVGEFVEQAVRSAVRSRRTQTEFPARGEEAWRQYQRTGQSGPVVEIVDRVQTRIDARRQELLAKV